MEPLLTHDQLVDWLIYHVPLKDSALMSKFAKPGAWDQRPFFVYYVPQSGHWYKIASTGTTPLEAYQRAATEILRNMSIHREITDLYWYWTF